MIVINLKNYVFGQEALDLARKIDIYCNKSIVAVPFTDIREISKNINLPIFAQHIDSLDAGRGTGYIIPEEIEAAGAKGSLINHSEHPISLVKIKKISEMCFKLKLKLIICTSRISDVEKLLKLEPFAIAYEEPSLIETGKSVTSHNPLTIKKFCSFFKNAETLPLCGAGITTAEDVKAAKELGCKGVLVSSAVAHSSYPEKFLKESCGVF